MTAWRAPAANGNEAEMRTQQFVEVDGASLEVQFGGAGKPVVCSTHQWRAATSGGDTFVGSAFADPLAGFGTMLEVNLRGAGASSPARTPRDLSMRQVADDLEEVRRRLGHPRWVVAGSSAGGFIGLLYALHHPAALAGLILASTAPSGRFRADPDCLYNPERPDYAAIQAILASTYAANASPEDARRAAELVYHQRASVEAQVARAARRVGQTAVVSDVVAARRQAMRSELTGEG